MFVDPCEILTVDEMSEILMIGKNSAYGLLNTGKVKGFRIGRIWKIPKSRLNEYIIKSSTADKG